MRVNTVIISTIGAAAITVSTVSCTAVATSPIGLTVIKQLLLGGINKSLSIFKNKDAFLQNDLISKAMPESLVKINNVLQNFAPGLVAKEKDYIAQAAVYTVNISEPILTNAVNSLTAEDVNRMASGTSATSILKEKTSSQLVSAILPKVDEKLNSFGIVKSINMALSGNSMISGILGGNGSSTTSLSATGGLSKLASEQIVNGLFSVLQNYEQENENMLTDALRRIK